ncbi:MAG: DegT/DnrJ/EryC1/StrS family aminotransferase [Alphaproteobacteria bacterium]|nr:DegT/DnrJ/EryC1/StrS family aminotransferase [Alphaproteobacteria bacterium]
MREIPFGRPIIGEAERAAVMAVLDGPILVHGPRATLFEREFAAWTGAAYATSTASCTAALHLAYFQLGLGAGDEVIVPAQTHAATAHAVELTGATPVFVDAEIATGNIDVAQIEAALTPRTRAISLVHYLGMPVDMDRVAAIAKRHGVFVVEDCALSLGARYRGTHTGLLGDIGCFSFYPVKHMTTAEGGMIISRHRDVVERIARQKALGVDRQHGERKIPGVYDVTCVGFNYRMNEIEAAIGIEQVKRLDDIMATRARNYRALYRGLREIDEIGFFETTNGVFESSYYCLSIVLGTGLADKRFELVSKLKEQGVGTSVYYPKAVPHLAFYREKYRIGARDFPVASRISETSIALPVGAHLGEGDMAYIVDALKSAFTEVGR